MRIRFLLIFFQVMALGIGLSQPVNDDCENAIELCSEELISGTTTGATIETCFSSNPNGCADDNNPCFVPKATVWYKFTTNSIGGPVTVDFTNVSINPDPSLGKTLNAVMVSSDIPCEGGNYSSVSPCINNGLGAFSITSSNALTPNSTYYIQVNGSGVGAGVFNPAEIDFDIEISGAGVTVLPMTVTISATNTVICQNDTVPVDIAFTNCSGEPRFEWFYNGLNSGNEVNFETNFLTKSGQLYLRASCGTLGCPNTDDSDSIFFDVTPNVANAGPDLLIADDEIAFIDGSGIGSPLWSPLTELINEDTYSPSSTVDETTTYTLTVTNGNCTTTDQMVVSLKSPINIPSGFTPNNDGNNDIWEIEFLNQYEDNQVIIYDRSGQVIYKTVAYNNGVNSWAGTYKDKPVPASTYFYFIDLRNGKPNSVFRGPVTVIR
ncbi:MAG: gliding motility-associated C-terminal domain-containing protein [Crocinitomicaceae bacterium]